MDTAGNCPRCDWQTDAPGDPSQEMEMAGMKIIVNPDIPDDEIHVRDVSKLIGKVINVQYQDFNRRRE